MDAIWYLVVAGLRDFRVLVVGLVPSKLIQEAIRQFAMWPKYAGLKLLSYEDAVKGKLIGRLDQWLWQIKLGVEPCSQFEDKLTEMASSDHRLAEEHISALRFEFPSEVAISAHLDHQQPLGQIVDKILNLFTENDLKPAVFTATLLARIARWIAKLTLEGRPLSVAFILPNRTFKEGEGGLVEFRKYENPLELSLKSPEVKKRTRELCEVARYPDLLIAVDLHGRATGLYQRRGKWAEFSEECHRFPSGDPHADFGYTVSDIGGIGIVAPGDGTVRLYHSDPPPMVQSTAHRQVGVQLALVHDGFVWHTAESHVRLRKKFCELVPDDRTTRLDKDFNVLPDWRDWLWALVLRISGRRKGGMIVIGPQSREDWEVFKMHLIPLRREQFTDGSPVELSRQNVDLLCNLVELDGATIVDRTSGQVVVFAQKILDKAGGAPTTTGTRHSAAKFIVKESRGKGVIALAISQDGPISLFFDSTESPIRTTF